MKDLNMKHRHFREVKRSTLGLPPKPDRADPVPGNPDVLKKANDVTGYAQGDMRPSLTIGSWLVREPTQQDPCAAHAREARRSIHSRPPMTGQNLEALGRDNGWARDGSGRLVPLDSSIDVLRFALANEPKQQADDGIRIEREVNSRRWLVMDGKKHFRGF
jgi:hypothetical protein